MIDTVRNRWVELLALPALALAVVCLYQNGLPGEFIFDDRHNLADVFLLAEGKSDFWTATTSNGSGPLGRPLSMLTFALNAVTTGDSVLAMKITNIVIHLTIGFLLFALTSLCTRAIGGYPAVTRTWIALGVTATWLVLPIQVSAVLYVIQRMAQLSALWLAVGLVVYVFGRVSLRDGRRRVAAALILGAFPACLLLAAFSKENGLLLVPLAFCVEAFVFRFAQNDPAGQRRLVCGAWMGIVALAACALIALLVLAPESLFRGYANRDFTLWERLLTQPRVLASYVAAIFVPDGARLGVFHDDFVVSTGVFAPPTTLLALVAWALVVAAAVWAWFRRWGLFGLGLSLFLMGHAVESTVLPLEMYFEHRNYLPLYGLLLSAAALLARAHLARLLKPAVIAICMAGYLGVLSFGTYARAGIWAHNGSIVVRAYDGHPNSARVNLHLAAIETGLGNLDGALTHLQRAEELKPRAASRYAVTRLAIFCRLGVDPPAAVYDDISGANVDAIDQKFGSVFRQLVEDISAGDCPYVSLTPMLQAFRPVVDKLLAGEGQHRMTTTNRWLTLLSYSRLMALAKNYSGAAEIAEAAQRLMPERADAWIYLAQLYLADGRPAAALTALDQAEATASALSSQRQAAIRDLRRTARAGEHALSAALSG